MRWIFQLTVILGLVAYGVLTGCSKETRISRLTVLISGHTQGYIANCGCALGQYGGLKRLARLVKEEAAQACKPHPMDKGLPAEALLIDIGDFTDYSTDVSRITSAGVVRGLATMDYKMVGLGLNELSYPQPELWELLGEADLPLTAANLRFVPPPSGADRSAELNALIEPYRIAELESGYVVGVIHVVDENVADVIGKLNGFELSDAAAAADDVLKQHSGAADFWLLSIADASQRGTNAEQIAKLSGLMMVIGYHDTNPLQKEGSTQAVFPRFLRGPMTKAKEVLRATAFFKQEDAAPVITYEQLPIPDTIKSDEQIDAIIADIAPLLERLEIEKAEEAAKKEIHPVYQGYKTCQMCHADIAEQMLATRHVHALAALVEKKQSGSAACLPCHVVGHASLPGVEWSGGWNIIAQPAEMEGVHCESCHGPGEYHVQLMQAGGDASQLPAEIRDNLEAEGRNSAGLLPAGEQTCVVCHDTLNSPGFVFEEYWSRIEH
jgi:hypothetical protein